jgi:aryl-phospho-beta-D-glucosidase BglC (GH1 family)
MRFHLIRFALFVGTALSLNIFVVYTRLLFFAADGPEDLLRQHLQHPVSSVGNTTKAELVNPPLRTRGRDVVDVNGKRFKLASVNWYGASDEQFIPGGLDIQHRSEIANAIKRMGFNSVRLPYADEMVVSNPLIPSELLAANPDLVGLRALDVYEAVVNSLTEAGLAVIVNNHITQATWCCGINPCDAAWTNAYLGGLCRVKQTEDQWIKNWEIVMKPYVNNSHVIGADLRNEVRGFWGTMKWKAWAKAAERAGNALLAIQPDWLIVVEGTSSSNDLAGVWERPVVLDVQDRVVYSSHVYSWSGWGTLEGRYAKRAYASFAKSMRENWAYLLDENIAPVWVGEIGAPHLPDKGDRNYWDNLLKFMKEEDSDFAYWAINPRKPHGNESESYSVLKDDWLTPIMDYRMRDMVQLMG